MRLRTLALAVVIVIAYLPPAYAQDHAQHYVLDAFGGVHAAGGAPIITPATPYFGFDVAANIEYIAVGTSVAVGDGYIVLDKWGGVHYGGALAADPPSGATPYFGFDAARAVVRRDVPSRIASASATSEVFVTALTYANVLTTSIYAPVDGFLHVVGNSYAACSAGSNLAFDLSMNVDAGTTDGVPVGLGRGSISDCTNFGGGFPADNQSLSAVYPVTAGQHTVNLLARKVGGDGTLRILGRTLTVQFIAANATGELSRAEQ